MKKILFFLVILVFGGSAFFVYGQADEGVREVSVISLDDGDVSKEKRIVDGVFRVMPEAFQWMANGSVGVTNRGGLLGRDMAALTTPQGVRIRPVGWFVPLGLTNMGIASGHETAFAHTFLHELVGHKFHFYDRGGGRDSENTLFWQGLFEELGVLVGTPGAGDNIDLPDFGNLRGKTKELAPSSYGYDGTGTNEWPAEWGRLYGADTLEFYKSAVELAKLGAGKFYKDAKFDDKAFAALNGPERLPKPHTIRLRAFSFYARAFSYPGIDGKQCTAVFKLGDKGVLERGEAVVAFDQDGVVRDLKVAPCKKRAVTVTARQAVPVSVFEEDIRNQPGRTVPVDLIARSESAFFNGSYRVETVRIGDGRSQYPLGVSSVDAPLQVQVTNNSEVLIPVRMSVRLNENVREAKGALPVTLALVSTRDAGIKEEIPLSLLFIPSVGQEGPDLEPMPIEIRGGSVRGGESAAIQNAFSITPDVLPGRQISFLSGVLNNTRTLHPEIKTLPTTVQWRVVDAKGNVLGADGLALPGLEGRENTANAPDMPLAGRRATQEEREAAQKYWLGRYTWTVLPGVSPGVYRAEFLVEPGASIVRETNEWNNAVRREFVLADAQAGSAGSPQAGETVGGIFEWGGENNDLLVIRPAAGQGARLYFDPPSLQSANSDFDVKIMLDTRGSTVVGARAAFTYDPEMLECLGIESAGSGFTEGVAQETGCGDGEGSATRLAPGGVSGGEVNVATIRFRFLKSGTATVRFAQYGISPSEVVEFGDAGRAILTDVQEGTYTFAGSRGLVAPNGAGGVVGRIATFAQELFNRGGDDEIVRQAAVPILNPGDVNRDGRVDIADLSLVARDFGREEAGLETDRNEDGRVDIADIVMVGQHFGE